MSQDPHDDGISSDRVEVSAESESVQTLGFDEEVIALVEKWMHVEVLVARLRPDGGALGGRLARGSDQGVQDDVRAANAQRVEPSEMNERMKRYQHGTH